MIGRRERDRCYLELWDAFHLKGCPVCNCIGKRVMRRVRDTLDGAHGKNVPPLCAYHTRVLAAGHDEYGSIAAVRFIRRAEGWIRNSLEKSKRGNGILGLVRTALASREAPCMEAAPSKCFACRLERHQQRSMLTVLVEALPDLDFHRAFQESDGLCVRHLCALSQRFSGKGAVDTVLQEQRRQKGPLAIPALRKAARCARVSRKRETPTETIRRKSAARLVSEIEEKADKR